MSTEAWKGEYLIRDDLRGKAHLQATARPDDSLTFSWLFRYAVGGHARAMGLGSYPCNFTLQRPQACSGTARAHQRGDDPLAERGRKKEEARLQVEQDKGDRRHTFGAAAESWFDKKE